MSTTTNYSARGRFRNLNSKSTNQKEEEEEESRFSMKSDKDGHELPKITKRIEKNDKFPDNEFVTLTVVTRGTSPTPPASSSYVRNKRAEINVVHQKEVIRLRKLPDTTDEEIQCDQMEETSRFSKYSNRVSGVPWSTHLDKYSGASSTGNPSIYSSRGFTNVSGRLNNFAYTRTNEAPATTRNESSAKESSSFNQEIYNSDNKSQNEKLVGDLKYTTSNDETLLASNDLKTSSNEQNIYGINKKDKIDDSERCRCGARKSETSGSSNNLKSSNHNLAFYHREDSIMQDLQTASRCDEYNQRRPSISRLERTLPKNEVKISKCSLKTEMTSSKLDTYNEKRGSTPKSDISSSSKTEESLRIVEGHCQDQNEEITSQKCDSSQRKDSTSRYVNLFSNN